MELFEVAKRPGEPACAATRRACSATARLRIGVGAGEVTATLEDKLTGLRVADGPLRHRAERQSGDVALVFPQLENPSVAVQGETLTLRGQLAGLDVEHTFVLPATQPRMEERIVLRNATGVLVALSDFEAGFQRRVTDSSGQVLPELAGDRWVAVPLRTRATDRSLGRTGGARDARL